MRAICQVCKDKDKCSYLANNRTRDCIDVQTSDYGYDEAIEKVCEWLKQNNGKRFNGFDIVYTQGFIEDFKKYMEEEL